MHVRKKGLKGEVVVTQSWTFGKWSVSGSYHFIAHFCQQILMQRRQWNRHSCEQESIISKFYLRECPHKYIWISTRVAFAALYGQKLLVFEFRCFQSLCCRCEKSRTSNFSSNCERMGCPRELIKFDKSNNSPMLQQVSLWYLFPLDIPQAAVSGIIAKWKYLGTTGTQQQLSNEMADNGKLQCKIIKCWGAESVKVANALLTQ